MLQKSKSLGQVLKRFLNLHEYQATQVLETYGLPTLKGGPARTPQEAKKIADEIAGPLVFKAQAHTGGRGRGHFKNSGLQSGVHLLTNADKVTELASKMLNDVLVTKQTGKDGKPVNTVYLVERVDVQKEIYLGLIIDRKQALPLLICSPKGGMGIEEIESKYILKEYATDLSGFSESQLNKIADFLELSSGEQKEQIKSIVKGLYKCLLQCDATLLEINPLGVLGDGKIVVCDSKFNVDDNSKPRQPKLFEMEDLTQKDPKEVQAEEQDLNYVKLDGSVGCLVNGAGLAMATMDLINFRGGKPANFLDIGGNATAARVKHAISIINDDKDVHSIFINIFGGIVRCDIVAEGIIQAVKELGVEKPIIMRIKGNNADIAKEMIESSGMKLYWNQEPEEAAAKAISFAK